VDLDPERGESGDDSQQRPTHPADRLGPDRREDGDEQRDRLGRDERDQLPDDPLLGVGRVRDASGSRAPLGDGVLL
jgi:hypothetical protein